MRIVYSPLDATRIAADNPDKEVVFFGVGFETTAPANAMSVLHGQRLGLTNFRFWCPTYWCRPPCRRSCRRRPTGCRASSPRVMSARSWARVNTGRWSRGSGFLSWSPVSSPGPSRGRQVVGLLESGKAELRNAYPRAVTATGNTVAQQALADVFVVTDRQWRGIGMIPQSGWTLSPKYAGFDAERRFGVADLTVQESAECHAGEVLQGLLKPNQCPAFGTTCTPRTPLGRRWCPARVRVRRTTSSGGWNLRRVSDPEGNFPTPPPGCVPCRCVKPNASSWDTAAGHSVRGTHREPFYLHSDRRVVRRATPRYSTLTAGASP